MVTVSSIKVIVELGGTYGFIKGKQNSNQFKVRSFNMINQPCKEVLSKIARAIYCLPQGFSAGCIIFVIL